MPGLPVAFTWGNLAQNYCFPGSLEQFKNDLFSLLMGTVSGNFQGVIIGPNLPTPTQQNYAWLKTDVSNNPISWFLFSGGQWLFPHPIAPGSKFRQIWKGMESDLWSEDGGDGTNPASSIPTLTSGAMWQIDPDFAFRVPVGVSNANMATSPVAYDGNPATVIHQGDLIGEEKHTLTKLETPTSDHVHAAGLAFSTEQPTFYKNGSIIISPGLAEHPAMDVNGPAIHEILTDTPRDPANSNALGLPDPKAHQNMQPGIVVGYAMRTARKYLVGG